MHMWQVLGTDLNLQHLCIVVLQPKTLPCLVSDHFIKVMFDHCISALVMTSELKFEHSRRGLIESLTTRNV